ncbi:MAG: polysaccharide deacetylase family protein [Burkholderiales bacterium]
MSVSDFRDRLSNKCRRVLASRTGRRDHRLTNGTPYISFTFDDFPGSAFTTGGRVLEKHGVLGTYYVSMEMLGRETEVGRIVSQSELREVVREGHEVGCHTFGHLDGAKVSPEAFESSICANQRAYGEIFPGEEFRAFAYPFDGPTARVKRRVRNRFVTCRGGGQTYNENTIDLALLNAYFLDRRNDCDLAAIAAIIERNNAARGWLIFATHDVSAAPSPYGCRPEFFDRVVADSVRSGARVLPVTRVCEELDIVSR